VFAPESQIANIQEKLARRGLTHIDVRSSEELEAARLVDIIDRGESKHERDQAREQTIADYVARNNLEEKLKEFQIDPLSRECKVSIVIPSYGEGSKVVDAIKTLLNQVDRSDNPVPIDDFEVIVVINQRANSTVEEIDDNQKSIEAIQRLLTQSAAEGKGIKNVHFIFKEFTPEEGGVGAARRLGSDLVVLRDHQVAHVGEPAVSVQQRLIQAEAEICRDRRVEERDGIGAAPDASDRQRVVGAGGK